MNSTIGVESWNAVCTPIAALVAPGPRVTKQMPGRPRQLAVRLGHVGRAALLAADDEADAVAVLVEAVEHGEEAFAGNAEGGVDALRDQRLDQGVAGGTDRCGSGHGAAGGDTRVCGGRAVAARRSGFVRMP